MYWFYWIADFIVIALLITFYFLVLRYRSISFVCPHPDCGKFIDSNTIWICGNNGCKNDKPHIYPFIYQCEHCGYAPKAYLCHHCREMIYFSKDEHSEYFARSATSIPSKPEKAVGISPSEALKENIQLGKLRVEKAKIDVELKGLTDELSSTKRERTAYDELEEYYKNMMGNEDAARKWKAAIDEEFKNDPEERKCRYAVVEQWMRNRSDM